MTHPIIAPSAVPAVIDKFKKIIELTKKQIEFCECRIDEDSREEWVLTTHNGTSFLHDLEASYGPAYHDQWNAAGLIHETPIFLPSQSRTDRIRLRRWPESDLFIEGWEEGVDYDYIPLNDACDAMRPLLHMRKARLQQLIDDFSKAMAA